MVTESLEEFHLAFYPIRREAARSIKLARWQKFAGFPVGMMRTTVNIVKTRTEKAQKTTIACIGSDATKCIAHRR